MSCCMDCKQRKSTNKRTKNMIVEKVIYTYDSNCPLCNSAWERRKGVLNNE